MHFICVFRIWGLFGAVHAGKASFKITRLKIELIPSMLSCCSHLVAMLLCAQNRNIGISPWPMTEFDQWHKVIDIARTSFYTLLSVMNPSNVFGSYHYHYQSAYYAFQEKTWPREHMGSTIFDSHGSFKPPFWKGSTNRWKNHYSNMTNGRRIEYVTVTYLILSKIFPNFWQNRSCKFQTQMNYRL